MDYEDLRRNSYIDAINLRESRKLVSYFGRLPWEIVYSFSIFAVPSYGFDLYVAEGIEEEEEGLCDLLKSTKIYLKYHKCPLMFSSSLFLMDDYCPLRNRLIEENTDRETYIYRNLEDLIAYLEGFTGRNFDQRALEEVVGRSKRIAELILEIRRLKLDIKEVFQLEYYTKFILDLDERILFLEKFLEESKDIERIEKSYIALSGGAGLYHHFSSYDKVILEAGCEGEDFIYSKEDDPLLYIKDKYLKREKRKLDIRIRNCPLEEGKILTYLGGS